jgi:two-component system sensor histidine kinase ArlS
MAIMNLVKNAVNYSGKENPAIAIAAAGKDVHINIVNDGPVIAPDEQAKLFKHSFRGKNSTGLKGFGLGLVLAHRIVSIHKGTLVYTIDGQHHNCFTLLLPIA